jgi:hypothetical protein
MVLPEVEEVQRPTSPQEQRTTRLVQYKDMLVVLDMMAYLTIHLLEVVEVLEVSGERLILPVVLLLLLSGVDMEDLP